MSVIVSIVGGILISLLLAYKVVRVVKQETLDRIVLWVVVLFANVFVSIQMNGLFDFNVGLSMLASVLESCVLTAIMLWCCIPRVENRERATRRLMMIAMLWSGTMLLVRGIRLSINSEDLYVDISRADPWRFIEYCLGTGFFMGIGYAAQKDIVPSRLDILKG